jgi:hypothetical protein
MGVGSSKSDKVYRDAADRKILEPIDYMIRASKKSKGICIDLHMAGYGDLSSEANALNAKVVYALENTPLEEWETK